MPSVETEKLNIRKLKLICNTKTKNKKLLRKKERKYNEKYRRPRNSDKINKYD